MILHGIPRSGRGFIPTRAGVISGLPGAEMRSFMLISWIFMVLNGFSW